ncbi:ABC transporter permease [Cellulomonas shaoxiangyii]|uniref:Transport permease protein n=1 Tax=Cellulomonas shaoxiangyii TaxID=2566013 RepID=A0A4P7SDV3_9CELL|nr:ABC transporter permease [Cellulomonas shaoxiangyii]QCB92259.1 ABC transporter permease [Cellulomonas shaoxiangyii]TGY85929.1 ABC transporter permease [Cellulomonas shaoxiangyii]
MTAVDLTPRPVPAPPRPGDVLRDTLALVGRSLRRSTRQLDTLLLAVLLPVVLLLLFVYVFGGAISSGMAYVDFVVPAIVLLTAGYGAATTAVDVASDMTNGIVDRFRSMPVPAGAVLTGHVAASLARNVVSTALVVAVALLVGFRPDASAGRWLAALGVLLVYVLALTWVAVAIGLVASGPEAASGFTFVIMFLPYVSSAFVPVGTMPSVLAALAAVNPVTPAADALRGLLLGLPADGAAVAAVASWGALLVVARVVAGALFRRRR